MKNYSWSDYFFNLKIRTVKKKHIPKYILCCLMFYLCFTRYFSFLIWFYRFWGIFRSLKCDGKWTKLNISDTIGFMYLIDVLKPPKMLVRFVLLMEKGQFHKVPPTVRFFASKIKISTSRTNYTNIPLDTFSIWKKTFMIYSSTQYNKTVSNPWNRFYFFT